MGRSESEAAQLDRLVREHLSPALQFATRLTGDPDAAEDVVQEALLRVARSWQTFRREASFRTWLFRIVINVFRDWLRARRDVQPLPSDAADRRANEPASGLLEDELRRLIAERVSALPPRQREVLVLVANEELPPREVAELLGITEGNVHATLYVARERLRRELAPYLIEK